MAERITASIKLIERITKNGICVGYTAVDFKNNRARISKDSALNYAKNNAIQNVAYRVTEGKPILYGINGFKVNDLPEVKLDVQPTLKIVAMYLNGNSIVGYLVLDTKSHIEKKLALKAIIELAQKKQIIGVDSLEKLKTIKCERIQLENKENKENKDELLNYYKAQKEILIQLLNRYVRILEVSGAGESGEKAKILTTINSIEKLIEQDKIGKDELIKKVEAMKKSLTKMVNDKTSIVKTSMLNQILSSLDESVNKLSRLKLKYRKTVEYDIMQVKTQITEIRYNLEFDEFIRKYQEIKKLLSSIDIKYEKLYKLQEDEDAKIKLREAYINNELSKMSDNELKPIKRKIIEKPWYIRYKSLMNSNSCLQTCIAQDESGRKLRLIDIDITEKFIGKQRVGFVLTYNGKSYEYNEKLTNISLIASFIKIADDLGLKNREISAKFKKDDNSILTLTV